MRLLATTDLHMQLLGHDYVTDKPLAHQGLSGLGTLIAQAREEASDRSVVLLDNGDFLQGNAFGGWLAQRPVTDNHPVVAALNTLGYDAIGLGNHDLDFGLGYLEAVASHLKMPVICTNLRHSCGDSLLHSIIVTCKPPPDEDKGLRLGVLSVIPEQTAVWNRNELNGKARVMPARAAIEKGAATLRGQGADLIVLLAHMGIAPDATQHPDDNAVPLAKVPGIDAIITGHTHRRFPGTDHVGTAEVDPTNGMLSQRPAVMAGHDGSDLAVLDLTAKRDASGDWQIIGHVSGLRRNRADTPPCPAVVAACKPAHDSARHYLAEQVGETGRDLHNFFGLAVPTAVEALTARAMARAAQKALAGTELGDLPLLACVAAHTTGGRGGPDNYLHIRKGAVRRRHLAGLAPYRDPIWAVQMAGRDLKAWLEQAACAFNRHSVSKPIQRLSDSRVPSFNFDTIFGINYRIDPRQSVGQRISGMCHAGVPIRADDQFVMATSPFRVAGGGGFAPCPADRICLRGEATLTSALADMLRNPDDDILPDAVPWRFACGGTVCAVLETAPKAVHWLNDLSHLNPKPDGMTSDGFARFRLTL